MIGLDNIDTQIKLMYSNILNMFIFDKFKTGNTAYDTILTTIIIMLISYITRFINVNLSNFTDMIRTREFDFAGWFYNKNIVEYEGKIGLTTTYYDNNLNQTNSFSDRFKALWFYIIEINSDNKTVNHIKEYAFDNYSKNNQRDFGIYMVIQDSKFLISKEHQIYAYTKITNEDKEEDKSSKNTNNKCISKLEKIKIQLFSYKSDIYTIKEFVENITKKYLLSIEDLRDNKKFIYTLTKAKYDECKNERWDENIFTSTRQFNNIFFENKEKLISKLDFFLNNKDWYFKKGIPYSIGIGMHGPPGTGKTSLIKAIANYTNRNVVVISLKLIKTKKQLDSIFFEERYNMKTRRVV